MVVICDEPSQHRTIYKKTSIKSFMKQWQSTYRHWTQQCIYTVSEISDCYKSEVSTVF